MTSNLRDRLETLLDWPVGRDTGGIDRMVPASEIRAVLDATATDAVFSGYVIQWRPAGTDRWSDYTQPPTEDDAVESLATAREASPASEFQCVQWWHRTEVLDL